MNGKKPKRAKETPIIPNIDWYTNVGTKLGLPRRCPLAIPSKCPKYFNSAVLFGRVHTRDMDKLMQKWDGDFPPDVIGGTYSGSKTLDSFKNFCPELVYEKHGYFATDLARYVDDFDSNQAKKDLTLEAAAKDDPRWKYMIVKPQHFSECKEYSILGNPPPLRQAQKTQKTTRKSISKKMRFTVFTRDGFKCIYCTQNSKSYTGVYHILPRI